MPRSIVRKRGSVRSASTRGSTPSHTREGSRSSSARSEQIERFGLIVAKPADDIRQVPCRDPERHDSPFILQLSEIGDRCGPLPTKRLEPDDRNPERRQPLPGELRRALGRLQGLREIAACFGDPSFDQRHLRRCWARFRRRLLKGTLSGREIMLVVQNQGISARGGTRLRIRRFAISDWPTASSRRPSAARNSA